MRDPVHAPVPSGVCVGIDLAGALHRETGIAVLRDGRLELLTSAFGDGEILALATCMGYGACLAINAPLGRPRGRCCLDDACGCRRDPGTRSRECERELLHMGIPILATALLKVLARRGYALGMTLRRAGWEPIEVYPYATLRLLGLPSQGKRTRLGRQLIATALQPLVPGFNQPHASEHQLDALVCAYTAALRRQGLTRAVGSLDEGLMVIPDPTAIVERAQTSREPVRRVAEAQAVYGLDHATPAPDSAGGPRWARNTRLKLP